MKAQITLDLSGPGFQPHAVTELTRILRKLADKLASEDLPNTCYLLHDADGRLVGQIEVTR